MQKKTILIYTCLMNKSKLKIAVDYPYLDLYEEVI